MTANSGPAQPGPTILSVEPDSAWVVIFVVSLVTYFAALLLRKLIGRPGGLAAGLFLALPLVLPLLAAISYAGSALPEVGVLKPAGHALRERSGELLHLLLLTDAGSKVVTPYALSGSAGSWLLGFAIAMSSFMLIRRGIGAIAIRRLVGRCTPLPDLLRGRVAVMVARLSKDARLRKAPEVLMLPSGAQGAFAFGARQQRILISPELLTHLDAAELEATLAHEIAHLEARDCQVMFGAGFLRDLVAWNPVAHLSYHRLRTDRELEADRRAASLTGKPLAVASSLLKVCEMVRGSKLRHRALVAFLRPGSRVSRRVKSLLALADGRVVESPPRYLPYALAAVLVAVIGLQAGARIAAEDTSALATMWGDRAPASQNREVRYLYRPVKPPAAAKGAKAHGAKAKAKGSRGKGANTEEPRYYAQLGKRFVVRDRDVKNWLRAMSRWAKQEPALVRLRWESRQDWRAVPLFGDTVGPFDLYTIQRQPL